VIISQDSTDTPSNSNSFEWFNVLRTEVHPILITDATVSSGVKVAIIDTGANFNKSQYKLIHKKRISGCRTWCDAKITPSGRSFMDTGGNIATKDLATDSHGTHSLSALRKVAPNCMIFVAQVFQGRADIEDRYPSEDQAQKIANVRMFSILRSETRLTLITSRRSTMPPPKNKPISSPCLSVLGTRYLSSETLSIEQLPEPLSRACCLLLHRTTLVTKMFNGQRHTTE
jgi:hypothetical protein